jgi:hypothetical protein
LFEERLSFFFPIDKKKEVVRETHTHTQAARQILFFRRIRNSVDLTKKKEREKKKMENLTATENYIISTGDRDIDALNADELLLYLCAKLQDNPNKDRIIYYYYMLDQEAVRRNPAITPSERKDNLLSFMADMFNNQSNFQLPLKPDYQTMEQYRNELTRMYPGAIGPQMKPDEDEDEYIADSTFQIAKSSEMKKTTSADPEQNPYLRADQQRPLLLWELDPTVYIQTELNNPLDPSNPNRVNIGNYQIDVGGNSRWDPTAFPWQRTEVGDLCTNIRNRIVSAQRRFEHVGSTGMTETYASLKSPEEANPINRIPLMEKQVQENLRMSDQTPAQTLSTPDLGTSAIVSSSLSVPPARQQSPVPIETPQANQCRICELSCIPGDIVNTLVQHRNQYLSPGQEGTQTYQENLQKYKNQIKADIVAYRRSRVPKGIVKEIFDAGQRYDENTLLGFLDKWMDDPNEEVFYALLHEGKCVQAICRKCLSKAYLKQREVTRPVEVRGRRMTFPYVELPGLTRQPQEGDIGRIYLEELGKEAAEYSKYQLLPELIEQETVEILPQDRPNYQVPWTWFDKLLGPYAFEVDSIVYYRANIQLAEVGSLAIGIIQSYDWDHFDQWENQTAAQLGEFPTRFIIQPLIPFFGEYAVESVRIDNVFPIGIEVPSAYESIKSRGQSYLQQAYINIPVPQSGTIHEQIQSIENTLKSWTGASAAKARLENLRAILIERKNLLQKPKTAAKIQELPKLIEKQRSRGMGSRVLRESPVSVLQGVPSREAALSSLERVAPGAVPVTTEELRDVIEQIEGAAPESEPEQAPNGRPLIDRNKQIYMTWKVSATKYRLVMQRTEKVTPPFEDTAVVLTATLSGVHIMRGGRDLYPVMVEAWNSIFGDIEFFWDDPTKYAFPGLQTQPPDPRTGDPGWPHDQYVHTVTGVQSAKVWLRNNGYGEILEFVTRILGRYDWYAFTEFTVRGVVRGKASPRTTIESLRYAFGQPFSIEQQRQAAQQPIVQQGFPLGSRNVSQTSPQPLPTQPIRTTTAQPAPIQPSPSTPRETLEKGYVFKVLVRAPQQEGDQPVYEWFYLPGPAPPFVKQGKINLQLLTDLQNYAILKNQLAPNTARQIDMREANNLIAINQGNRLPGVTGADVEPAQMTELQGLPLLYTIKPASVDKIAQQIPSGTRIRTAYREKTMQPPKRRISPEPTREVKRRRPEMPPPPRPMVGLRPPPSWIDFVYERYLPVLQERGITKDQVAAALQAVMPEIDRQHGNWKFMTAQQIAQENPTQWATDVEDRVLGFLFPTEYI